MKLLKLISSLGISFAAGAIGSLATISSIPSWYATLEKPFFNPPNWLFGPVWTVLYVLIGISLYLVWVERTKKSKRNAYTVFAVQLILNALWSLVFFGLQQPWLGLVVIFGLDAMVVVTIWKFSKVKKAAAYLLIPYLAWISFATILNLSIALLN